MTDLGTIEFDAAQRELLRRLLENENSKTETITLLNSSETEAFKRAVATLMSEIDRGLSEAVESLDAARSDRPVASDPLALAVVTQVVDRGGFVIPPERYNRPFNLKEFRTYVHHRMAKFSKGFERVSRMAGYEPTRKDCERRLETLNSERDFSLKHINIAVLDAGDGWFGKIEADDVDSILLVKEECKDILCDRYDAAKLILERYIGPDKQAAISPELQSGIDNLVSFVDRNGSKGLRRQLLLFLSEHAPSELVAKADPLPASAPISWTDKLPGENPPAFVKRVYGQWLGKGFTRATLRHLDPPLAQAMTNWLRNNEMPPDVDLPTLKEQNTRWVDRIEREGLASVIPESAPASTLRHASRLLAAKQRRHER